MLGLDRQLFLMDVGALPERELHEALDLMGSDVLPTLPTDTRPATRGYDPRNACLKPRVWDMHASGVEPRTQLRTSEAQRSASVAYTP